METLNRDITEEIALKLNPADLVNLCSTNTIYNKLLCNSDRFWLRKLRYDYPNEIGNITIKNPKNVYMKRFLYVTEKIEEYMKIFTEIVWDDFEKYLNDKYRKDLYDAIYGIYKYVITEHKQDDIIDQDEIDDIFNDFMAHLMRDSYDQKTYRKLEKYQIQLVKDFQHTPKVSEFL